MDDKYKDLDAQQDGQEDSGRTEPGMSLHMKLGGGESVDPDYSAQAQAGSGRLPERQDAGDMDSGVALHMKLGGAGDPVRPDNASAEPAGSGGGSTIEGSRLCPGCNKITEFSRGTCPECGFQYSAASSAAPPAFEEGGSFEAPAASAVGRIVLIVVLVGVLGFVLSRVDWSSLGGGTGAKQQAATPDIEAPFIAVSIDDKFLESLGQTLEAANSAWESAGLDAYVYRYRVESRVEPATSQKITATAWVGGKAAAEAVSAPADQPFRNAMASYLISYTDRTGLSYDLVLQQPVEGEQAMEDDRYIRWGYHYGVENSEDIEVVVNAINSYKSREGEYPHLLSDVSANRRLENRGFSFIPGGYGYLPIFATDSRGVVPFGSGSTKAELYPREVSGYYLVRFLSDSHIGVDLLSDEAKTYYLNKISPLPCVQKGELRNLEMKPDGKPDGIAWVVKTGEILDV